MGCTKAPPVLADVLAPNGLGFDALGSECAALNAPSLDSIAPVADCVARRHACRIAQMLGNQLRAPTSRSRPAPSRCRSRAGG